jgi:hypothetical protein
MKKIFILFVAFSLTTTAFAFSGFSFLPKKASEVYLPVGSGGQKISLLDLSKIDVKSFEILSGRHLNFFDRLGFKLAQKKLRKSINADGTIDNKKLNKFLAEGDHTTGFHLGGFALGFLVGLIGVLIAYLINDENKKNRVKWAWIGFGIGLVLYLIIILA